MEKMPLSEITNISRGINGILFINRVFITIYFTKHLLARFSFK